MVQAERYDIRISPTGRWQVIDTANGNGVRATFPTREQALKVAKQLDRR